MLYRDKNFPKHDCPCMFGGGWTDWQEGVVGMCSCGRPYRVIRPAFADRRRWQRIIWPSTQERAIIEEGETVRL
jgi:hypothetical protein